MAKKQKKQKKRMKGRPRGGASHPCPKCGGNTEVIITAREEGIVVRDRRCLKKPTHKFRTEERATIIL